MPRRACTWRLSQGRHSPACQNRALEILDPGVCPLCRRHSGAVAQRGRGVCPCSTRLCEHVGQPRRQRPTDTPHAMNHAGSSHVQVGQGKAARSRRCRQDACDARPAASHADPPLRNPAWHSPHACTISVVELWGMISAGWCRHPDSNWGPTAYKAVALPTELCRQRQAHCAPVRILAQRGAI